MRTVRCESCNAEMKKTGKMQSGNSVFTSWQCTKCLHRKTVCEGVSGIAARA